MVRLEVEGPPSQLTGVFTTDGHTLTMHSDTTEMDTDSNSDVDRTGNAD